ncbi:uncharacterized protein PHALS_13625 [Plasmopara halstedii]|uniref:Uncharacterized protein n=1 Tax=Plasmopara halstedii TaxID=4781 RepID=A0A0P1APJ2_PLAHL|nr:uncharacterized protein PHALS_13625 [Plasmopara halstedii]CEG43430.1 hypothetical protein PHALS_13625 [Plasmopara halstedii]|eukprot:XP_024579799.1 hypothetical protein PHALS_13625 [Plasmopara halstedii]
MRDLPEIGRVPWAPITANGPDPVKHIRRPLYSKKSKKTEKLWFPRKAVMNLPSSCNPAEHLSGHLGYGALGSFTEQCAMEAIHMRISKGKQRPLDQDDC